MPQCNITITPHQEKFVESLIREGYYGNVSEVFREGLRLLEREEQERIIQLEQIDKRMDKVLDQYKNGDFVEFQSKDEMNEWFVQRRKTSLEK